MNFLKTFLAVTLLVSGAQAKPSENCESANTMRVFYQLQDAEVPSELVDLIRFVCAPGNDAPTGHVFYPNGNYAYVGPGFQDTGSWKYPNGNYAFVGPNYQDKGSWKYPNGNFAFVGPNYQDKGSWKYPNGNFAFVGPNYQDKDSWKYPNGNYAFVGPNYQDKDSWKYPNGNFAFVGPNYQDKDSWKYPTGVFAYAGPNYSDAGTWYYPNKNVYSTSSGPNRDAAMLVHLTELHKGVEFSSKVPQFHRLPRAIKIMLRLVWVQEQLN